MNRQLILLVSLVTLCLIQVNAQSLTDGLVGDYLFTGNANDASVSANNGTVNGATLTTDRFGNANSAYLFDGINDYIQLDPTPLLNSNYTYSIWVKVNTNPTSGNATVPVCVGWLGGDQSILNCNNYNTNTGWTAVGYNPDVTDVVYDAGTMTTEGVWYHVVSVRDDDYVYLYINGELSGSTSTSGKVTYYGSTSRTAIIGARCNLIQYFNGAIDDVKIYNRALSACEISHLYEENDFDNGLLGYYPFSGNANDASVSANNGTVNGATLTTDRFGNANSAYLFDGINDYIQLDPTLLQNAHYTYSVWVKVTANPTSGNATVPLCIGWLGGDQSILNCNNYNGNTGWTAVGYNPDVTDVVYDAGTMTTEGVWYHVISVRDDDYVYLYINGELAGSTSTNGKAAYYGSSSRTAMIGARCNLIQYFNGSIDDVRIYNRALSLCEIEGLYENESDGIITGMEPAVLNENSIIVFPNPAHNGNFQVIIPSELEDCELTMYNSIGETVYRQTNVSGNIEISRSLFDSEGVYVVTVKSDAYNKFFSQKIILK